MLKTHMDKAKVYVTARCNNESSVLRENRPSRGLIAKVVRNAEADCYVIQTIRRPTEVKSEYTLNGAAFDPGCFKK